MKWSRLFFYPCYTIWCCWYFCCYVFLSTILSDALWSSSTEVGGCEAQSINLSVSAIYQMFPSFFRHRRDPINWRFPTLSQNLRRDEIHHLFIQDISFHRSFLKWTFFYFEWMKTKKKVFHLLERWRWMCETCSCLRRRDCAEVELAYGPSCSGFESKHLRILEINFKRIFKNKIWWFFNGLFLNLWILGTFH